MTRARYIILAMAAVMVLTAAMPAPATGNSAVLARTLLERLPGAEGDLEVIIQFDHTLSSSDHYALKIAGMEPIQDYDFVNAVFARGPSAAILRASNIDGIKHIEYNFELEYHMQETTNVVNATLVWNTMIQDSEGDLMEPIDGEGVTVVVIDSGIDAGHPDLDYGDKTIYSKKLVIEDGVREWREIENGDTSSGHGTHCAGTIAGNGDASGGQRAGVAPGANLIGLSTGDGPMIINGLGAFDWVYENSRPGHNPHNIRVVSNSWGSTEEYDRENVLNEAIRRITYDNNVVVVMSSGNAGTDNHDGSEVTTNPYSLEPSNIGIAAMSHDGNSMASFSSRGAADDDFTWPDLGAPGVAIWSTQARETYISTMTRQDGDAYYFAISGTSMSCPHISGMTALLWQACPELRVSNIADDNAKADASYFNDTENFMHEAEIILKLACRFLNSSEDGVPQDNGTSDMYGLGLPNDYAQGYGIVDVNKAVSIALTLHQMRQVDPDITVLQAYENHTKVNATMFREAKTDSLETTWSGEWGQFSDIGSTMSTDQSRMIYIPPEASKVTISLHMDSTQLDGFEYVDLWLTHDGTILSDYAEITVSGGGGTFWTFDIDGRGFAAPNIGGGPIRNQFREALVEYEVSVKMVLDGGDGPIDVNISDYHAIVSQWEYSTPSPDAGNTTIRLETRVYDLGAITEDKAFPAPPDDKGISGVWIALIVLIALGVLFYLWQQQQKKNKPFEAELVEAEQSTVLDVGEPEVEATTPE